MCFQAEWYPVMKASQIQISLVCRPSVSITERASTCYPKSNCPVEQMKYTILISLMMCAGTTTETEAVQHVLQFNVSKR